MNSNHHSFRHFSFINFCLGKSIAAGSCPGYVCLLKDATDYEYCVEDFNLCDGYQDCDDGSDEMTEEECSKMKSNTLL